MRPEFGSDTLTLAALSVAAIAAGTFIFLLLRRAWIFLRGRATDRLARRFRACLAPAGTRPADAAAAVRLLGRATRVRIDALITAAGRSDGPTRDALRHAGLPARLVQVLAHARDPWARAAAARALGKLGFTCRLAELAAALDDPETDVAYAAAQALADLGSAPAAEVLLRSLTRDNRLSNSRLAAILASVAGNLQPVLAQLARSDDAVARFWALTLIGARREFELLEEAVRPALAADDTNVRTAAVKCVSRLAVPLSDRWLEPLLADAAWVVRAQAAKALGEMGSRWAADGLADLLVDREWWCRHNALEALVRLGPPSLRILERVLEHSPDPFARNAAVEALERLGWFERCLLTAARGNPRSAALLTVAGACGGAGYMENLLLTAGPGEVPMLLEILGRVGTPLTAGRIALALERGCIPAAAQARAREIAARLQSA